MPALPRAHSIASRFEEFGVGIELGDNPVFHPCHQSAPVEAHIANRIMVCDGARCFFFSDGDSACVTGARLPTTAAGGSGSGPFEKTSTGNGGGYVRCHDISPWSFRWVVSWEPKTIGTGRCPQPIAYSIRYLHFAGEGESNACS